MANEGIKSVNPFDNNNIVDDSVNLSEISLEQAEREYLIDPNTPIVDSSNLRQRTIALDNNSEQDNNGLDYNDVEREALLGEGRDQSGETDSLEDFMLEDDLELPTLTFRFWILSILFGLILAFTSQFFFFRATPLSVGGFIIQLLTYPCGVLMAKFLPEKPFRIWRWQFSLNPGPFNVKEHALITVCAGSCGSTAYAMDIIIVKKLYYKEPLAAVASLLLLVSSQFMGYGFAGLYRKFLVRPKSMVWPSTLVSISVFRALHQAKGDDILSGKRLRKFFIIVSIASFFYYFLPGYLFTTLTSISILCLAYPNNKIAQQLGSGINGLGIAAISLDWNSFTSYIGSPLVTPFWAQVNTFVGFALVCWIIVPIGYYFNLWDALIFPIFGSELFDIKGRIYDRLRITPNHVFSEEAYKEYSPLRLTFFFAITYGISFATLTSLITHTALYHGKEIMERLTQFKNEADSDDPHCKGMDNYEEVPNWWYLLTFILSFVMAVIVCEVYKLTLPWWGLLIAVVISFSFTLPIGIVNAITNQSPGLNVLTEFIGGYLFPGYPIANVTFKVYGYITMAQSLNFLSDLKMGHYLKVPPRSMFIAQLIGTLLAILVNLATAEWLMATIPNICTPKGYPWICPSTEVFYSASVIWGLIGPAKMFSPGSMYYPLLFSFIIGLVLPVPFYLLSLKFPNSFWQYVHVPVIVSATAILPPARPGNYLTWVAVGFIFHVLVKRFNRKWYDRFHLILSAALDTGVAFAALLIFFAFELTQVKLDWWGNQKDFHCPLAKLPGK